MFMLYSVLLGLLLGRALGGRIEAIGDLRIRWAPFAMLGLAVQLALFSAPVTAAIGDLGAPIYVGSSAAVFAVVLRNWRVPGLPIVALGAGSNLAAIVANGGFMPASSEALAALGKHLGPEYSNSAAVAAPLLAALTDIFALPRWLPFANVFSIGDALIGLGVLVAIVVVMRRGASPPRPIAETPDADTPGTADPRPEQAIVGSR
jgi:hypothetical protein